MRRPSHRLLLVPLAVLALAAPPALAASVFQAHLSGRVAEALMAQAPELFAQPPEIKPIDVIAAKLSG